MGLSLAMSDASSTGGTAAQSANSSSGVAAKPATGSGGFGKTVVVFAVGLVVGLLFGAFAAPFAEHGLDSLKSGNTVSGAGAARAGGVKPTSTPGTDAAAAGVKPADEAKPTDAKPGETPGASGAPGADATKPKGG